MIGLSCKAVSKWETAKGLPDISLIESLSRTLGVSVMELMSGETVINKNASSNMLLSKFYVCPVCGNIIHSAGDALISCCGVTLPALEPEEADEEHAITMEQVEDEQFITVRHPMSKEHFISFLAHVTSDRLQLVKFYPEGNADAEAYIALQAENDLRHVCSEYLVSDGHTYASPIDKVFKRGHVYDLADIKTTYRLDTENVSWQLSVYVPSTFQ